MPSPCVVTWVAANNDQTQWPVAQLLWDPNACLQALRCLDKLALFGLPQLWGTGWSWSCWGQTGRTGRPKAGRSQDSRRMARFCIKDDLAVRRA